MQAIVIISTLLIQLQINLPTENVGGGGRLGIIGGCVCWAHTISAYNEDV